MDQTIIGSNRKIDPNRRAHLKADLTPDDNDRVEIGPTALAFAEWQLAGICLLYTSPSPRDRTRSRMPSSA